MNGLTLRINPSNNSKMKSIRFGPVTFEMPETIGNKNKLFNEFLNATSADEQIVIIKKIVDEIKTDSNIMKFIAQVFLQAEVKHPVKCFLVRHITRSDSLQPAFSEELSQYIGSYTSRIHTDYHVYMTEVSKIATCIENFPAGVAAIKVVETDLAFYLVKCLQCCNNTIRETKSLAPTEKNEIFSLAHLSLRLLLCIVQKVNEENKSKLISIFEDIRLHIKELLFDEDPPMDTKTLSGILFLTMENLENGPDSWIKILDPSQADDYIRTLLCNESAELSLHSAIVTVVPLDRLKSRQIGDTPALISLTDHIIAIGERTSSESTFTLIVARTIVQISKWLPKLGCSGGSPGLLGTGETMVTGVLMGTGELMGRVAQFCWSHADHYMDSVRHLAAQALANISKCAANLDARGKPAALQALVHALNAVSRDSKSYYVAISALGASLPARRLQQLLPRAASDVIRALQMQHVQASASVALEVLLEKHGRESDTKGIYDTWVAPALKHAAAAATSATSDSATSDSATSDSATSDSATSDSATSDSATSDSATSDSATSDSAPAHAALHTLMAKVVRLDDRIIDYILPEINRLVSSSVDIRCGLILVHVMRKAGLAPPTTTTTDQWRGVLPYHVMYAAATSADHDIRILCLALIAESPKSTEWYYEEEFDLILYYLKYNINAQAPNYRQHMLALFNKFIKRVGDSYKLLKRQNENTDKLEYYLRFVERLRCLCLDSLVLGANYSRRVVALQVLLWCQDLGLEGSNSTWNTEYVERLLHRLEDTYDANRELALRAMLPCPSELLKRKSYRVSIDLESILRQASSLKPTDCVSASYKLLLLKQKLPDEILQANPGAQVKTEPVWFALLSILLQHVKEQSRQCAASLICAARDSPLYGLLHCMRPPIMMLDARSISSDGQWSSLITDVIATCMQVCELVAPVVNNSSPEGHLPMDAGVTITDTSNSSGVVLSDGRPVTAQMLLLCAWRSVKEVSLLLGCISSRLTISGEGQDIGTLSIDQVLRIGDHFTKLLSETKHRGAFEQAYVGFTQLLARLWQCRSPQLHSWGRTGARALLGGLTHRTDATRRSAGLPFMIQALVITELQVKGNPTCLHECMNTLLKLARTTSNETTNKKRDNSQLPPDKENDKETKDNKAISSNKSAVITNYNKSIKQKGKISSDLQAVQDNYNVVDSTSNHNNMVDSTSNEDNLVDSTSNHNNMVDSTLNDNMVETRTHCMNILRALFRNSALEESVAGYVGDGLMVALEGFDRDTWMERNAATLLFSALIARVFGAGAARGRDNMTGRIFFLRYPALYDYILKKKEEAEHNIEFDLSPGLFPVLTILGRLYPSSLEGVESALRVGALVGLLPAAARAPARAARAAAARAPPTLLHAHRYVAHIESTLTTISCPSIKRNYCHGMLLQITKLLEAIPEELVVDNEAKARMARGIKDAMWILEQAVGGLPCYMLADEFVKVVNLFVWRFSTYIEQEQKLLESVKTYLNRILFAESIPPITSGREICLANITYLYIIILNKQCQFNQNTYKDIIYFVKKCLAHKTYEVVLSALNYLLILHKNLDIDCNFQRHLCSFTQNKEIKSLLKQESFIQNISDVLKRSKYLECIQKSLKILALEDDTQKFIVELKLGRNPLNNEEIVRTLIDCIYNEHENFTHIYLESLLSFVAGLLDGLSDFVILDVIRVMFDRCTSENNDNTRRAVAKFLQEKLWVLLDMRFGALTEEQKFGSVATLYASVVTCLEDDDAGIRQGVADAIWRGLTDKNWVGVDSKQVTLESDGAGFARGGVIPSLAGAGLRGQMTSLNMALPLLIAVALLDFRSEVCMADELSDECRVFDQNERYNIYLEETVWTSECADKIIQLTDRNTDNRSAIDCVRTTLDHSSYSKTFQKLCGDNLVLFKRMLEDERFSYKYDVVNPKIEMFVSKLLS